MHLLHVSRTILIISAASALSLRALPSAQTARGAAPPPAARTEQRVPFGAGELLTYDVSWSNLLVAGTATLNVREKRPSFGSTAYYIVAEGQPAALLSKLYSVYYKADTLMDVYSLLPQQGMVQTQEGGRVRTKTTRFDHAGRSAIYDVQPATSNGRRRMTIPSGTHDALSAFMTARSMALKTGTRVSIPIANDGQLFSVQLTVGARETVSAGIGELPAWKVVPVILDEAGRAITEYALGLWITDDVRRLPVRIEADLGLGTFVFNLRAVAAR